jgi:hypothetical protein
MWLEEEVFARPTSKPTFGILWLLVRSEHGLGYP